MHEKNICSSQTVYILTCIFLRCQRFIRENLIERNEELRNKAEHNLRTVDIN